MPLTNVPWRGVFTIPVTPFNEDGSIDWASLRNCVEFCIEAGAHGIVMPVNASEFFTLTDDERDEVVRVGVEVTDGAVPFVAGTTGVSPQHAIARSLAAQEAGADSVMVLPPPRVAGAAQMEEHYRAVGEAISIPLFIQNHTPPAGTVIPNDVMIRLLQEVPMIQYLKEESMPPGHVITAVLEGAGDACKGVMGGVGGRYILDEFRRGSCGTMPGCQITDAAVAVWDALERGGTDGQGKQVVSDEARDLYQQILPAITFESLYGAGAYKAILHRRGVIASTTMRIPSRRVMDAIDYEEMDIILDRLSPLLSWKKG
ncbi:MAG: dihydrodipicolinate synthase family protein [Chloroflexi bacterium]|nr:dihydrodipicolinate synthase family protein [Chloroflexota bacterium]MDA1298236.1 dihydrodipicolinate synthase family protein [Chloroflexota bacterium]